jgi:short-subunit dehydrogenase
MKKAIIVGASSGIGKEIALSLLKDHYKIGITGRRINNLEEIKKIDPKNIFVSSYDCTKESNAKKLGELAKLMGGLDMLVISSGFGDVNKSLEFSIEDKTNQLNVVAFTETVGWGFNYFSKQNSGHIVAISSIAGIRGNGLAPSYNASKAYQINYLEGLRFKAFRLKKSIDITDVRPGYVDTEILKGNKDKIYWVQSLEKATKQIMKAIYKKKKSVYITKRYNIVAFILKFIPERILKKLF